MQIKSQFFHTYFLKNFREINCKLISRIIFQVGNTDLLQLLFYFILFKGRPRRDRNEMHKELFLRKRSRKGLLSGPVKSNLQDFEISLGTIESEESGSSGDETYLVPSSKAMAKST